MDYKNVFSVLLISSDAELRKNFYQLFKNSNTFKITVVSNFNYINNQVSPKIIFFEIFKFNTIEKAFSYLTLLKDRYDTTPIIVISNYNNIETVKKLFRIGVEYILDTPLNLNLVKGLIYKHLIKLRDKQKEILIHRGITLSLDAKFVDYHGCRIFLSHTETLILSVLMTESDYISIKYLTKNLKNYKVSSEECLRITLFRLRKKFKEVTGLDVIKNRYGQGYYIAI